MLSAADRRSAWDFYADLLTLIFELMSSAHASNIHKPVMPDECVSILDAAHGGLFVDATLGLGGHAELILNASDDAIVIGIDQDQQALDLANERLSGFAGRFFPVKSNFATVEDVVRDAGLGSPRGILADLGVSSLQLDSGGRGFSFRFDAPLDMRMDPESGGVTAAELLATLEEGELANLIYRFGDERASRKIARWIVEKRKADDSITTTFALADLVRRAVKVGPSEKTHPATRTFQALRIAVNDELLVLERFIDDAVDVLDPSGVLAIITFHSLEDRIVKQAFRRLAGQCQCPPKIPQCVCGAEKKIEILTRKPIVPTAIEESENSRSRSAKLRAARKLAT